MRSHRYGHRSSVWRGLLPTCWLAASVLASDEGPAQTSSPGTRVVFLGTGTPRPDPKRSGPATAIVVNGSPYLVDFGPGVVGRAVAAFDAGVRGVAVEKLDIAFVTHLHSDHTSVTRT